MSRRPMTRVQAGPWGALEHLGFTAFQRIPDLRDPHPVSPLSQLNAVEFLSSRLKQNGPSASNQTISSVEMYLISLRLCKLQE